MNEICITEACFPSPCINNGTCVTSMDGGNQETFHCVCTPQFTGVYCEATNPSTNGNILYVITCMHPNPIVVQIAHQQKFDIHSGKYLSIS